MNEAKWVRVSIEVEAEAAESIAEVFSRYADEGVVIEVDKREGASALHRVSAYIANDGDLPAKKSQIENVLATLRMISDLPPASYEGIHEENWMEAWKERYQPIEVGERFLIQPAWIEIDEEDRLPILIDPGMAFGTGVHPTTQLSMELMEKRLLPEMNVLDMGSGSGILSFAAEKLGAASITAVEIDAQAIGNAEHNAKLNKSEISFQVGSIEEAKGLMPVGGFELLLANILATILMQLLDGGLADLITKKGQIIFSGILAEQEGEFLSALERAGLESKYREQRGDWLAFVAGRKEN